MSTYLENNLKLSPEEIHAIKSYNKAKNPKFNTFISRIPLDYNQWSNGLDLSIGIEKYCKYLEKHYKNVKKEADLRQEHYIKFIKDLKVEEEGHRYFRIKLLELVELIGKKIDDAIDIKKKINDKEFESGEYVAGFIEETVFTNFVDANIYDNLIDETLVEFEESEEESEEELTDKTKKDKIPWSEIKAVQIQKKKEENDLISMYIKEKNKITDMLYNQELFLDEISYWDLLSYLKIGYTTNKELMNYFSDKSITRTKVRGIMYPEKKKDRIDKTNINFNRAKSSIKITTEIINIIFDKISEKDDGYIYINPNIKVNFKKIELILRVDAVYFFSLFMILLDMPLERFEKYKYFSEYLEHTLYQCHGDDINKAINLAIDVTKIFKKSESSISNAHKMLGKIASIYVDACFKITLPYFRIILNILRNPNHKDYKDCVMSFDEVYNIIINTKSIRIVVNNKLYSTSNKLINEKMCLIKDASKLREKLYKI